MMTRRACLSLTALGVVGAALRPASGRAPSSGRFRIFVTNERAGNLSVIDGRTLRVTATLPLGKRPRGLKLSPDGRFVYVALSGSPIAGPTVDPRTLPPADKGADGIGVVDVASLQLVRILRGVSDPEQLAVSSDGTRLFVASEDTGQAIVMDAQSGAVIASLPVGGEPEGVTISPDGRFVYMSSEEDHVIAVIDTRSTRVVANIRVGERPRYTAFSTNGRRAYVSGEVDGTITVIDAVAHRALRTIQLEGPVTRPVGIAVSQDDQRLYVVTGRGGQLLAIDSRTGRVLASARVGPRPWGVALSPDGRRLFTANGPSNDVSVVDARTFRIERRIAVGESPWGLIVVAS
jgi:PQQ-dependent catabolism-associated beta-propeller protein